MSRLAGQSQSRMVMALALICLLLTTQFIVAQHSVAHIFEKNPAHEKHQNACGICLASHVIGSAVAVFASVIFIILKPQYDREPQAPCFAAIFSKAFYSTGPPGTAY